VGSVKAARGGLGSYFVSPCRTRSGRSRIITAASLKAMIAARLSDSRHKEQDAGTVEQIKQESDG